MRSGHRGHAPRPGRPVPHHRGPPLFIPQLLVLRDVLGHLRIQGDLQHATGDLTGQLVQIQSGLGSSSSPSRPTTSDHISYREHSCNGLFRSLRS
jgi:hypothetical protein